ncbi:MAG TPA: hypothetical protein VIM41_04995, partial [Gammaproteobacteria bacterium]
LVVDQPINGFIITPPQTPPDGIPGKRLIYQDGALWSMAQNQTSLTGGNIDWKGWYANGKPTRSLSWQGPISRYFSQAERNAYTGIHIPFSDTIYEDGKVLAKVPYPYLVFGAAVSTDNDGNHWIVVICNDKSKDAVLIKPYARDLSTQWYNADTAPFGWQLLGQFPMAQNRTYPAAVPWFFNADGNEARTMRDDGSVLAGGAKFDKLKLLISIDSKTAGIQNLGNGAVSTNTVFNRNVHLHNGYYIGEETLSTSANGSVIIAVDFGGDTGNEPLFAKVNYSESSISTSQLGEAINDLSESGSHSVHAELIWAGKSTSLIDKSAYSSAQLTNNEGSPITFSDATPSSHSEKIVFMDLRSGILSTEVSEFSSNQSESGGSVHRRRTNVIRAPFQILKEVLILEESESLGPSSRSIYWNYGSGSSSYTTNGNAGFIVPKVNASIYTPWESQDYLWEGSWVTDLNGNMFISQELVYSGSFHGYLTIFSGGNIEEITNAGGENTRYFPAYTK